MKIFVVAPVSPSKTQPGGTGIYSMSLVRYLSKSEDVSLVGIGTKDTDFPERIKFIPMCRDEKVSTLKYVLSLFLHAPNVDNAIVHAQTISSAFPFVFYRSIKRFNPSIIVTLHGLETKAITFRRGSVIGWFYSQMERFVFKRVDVLIAVDEKTRDYYLGKYPFIINKIRIIPVGIDLAKFKPMDNTKVRQRYGFNNEDKIILYVGRFSKEKGLDLLLKSFKEVKKEMGNAKLVLVGDGVERRNLVTLKEELELEDVTFIKTIEHDKIPDIMNCADVFVLCSLYEGMPISVLESLACGIPVVSTNVGDIHKVVIDGKTGYLVNERDEKIVKGKIIEVITGNGPRENCVKIVQKYSWDNIVELLRGVYDDARKA